jgi:peptidyl-prolyl cis-trans isomerase C
VVARVNGADIHESEVAMAEEELGAALQRVPPQMRREQIISYLSSIALLSQAAGAKKTSPNADVQQRLAFLRKKLTAEAYLRDEVKAALTDEELHKVYDEIARSMAGQEEVHARHILFRVENAQDEKANQEAEAKAKAALERIKKGEDFAALAAELTEEPAGKERGGDLGYFTKDRMVPEFADVAFKMYAGQVSNPVKTAFGWHIIKVEDKRQRKVPEFDLVKDQIAEIASQRAQGQIVEKLRAAAKIERVGGEPPQQEGDRPALPTDHPPLPTTPAEK